MKSFFGVSLVILALAAPVRAQGNANPVLDRLLTDFVAAYNANDATKVASFYAEDGVLMSPNAPMIRGRANIQAAFQKQMEQGGVLKLSPLASEISGPQGFAVGTYTVTISRGSSLTLTGAGGGGSTTVAAKFLTVFKRVGNDWKIAYDMQNADQPPPK